LGQGAFSSVYKGFKQYNKVKRLFDK